MPVVSNLIAYFQNNPQFFWALVVVLGMVLVIWLSTGKSLRMLVSLGVAFLVFAYGAENLYFDRLFDVAAMHTSGEVDAVAQVHRGRGHPWVVDYYYPVDRTVFYATNHSVPEVIAAQLSPGATVPVKYLKDWTGQSRIDLADVDADHQRNDSLYLLFGILGMGGSLYKLSQPPSF